MPKIFIIIVNYNCFRDTIECLESLKKITYPNYQIFVIDNASTDKSFEKISKYLNKNILNSKFNILNSNTGFAGGCNIGIKQALKKEADYILLLNPDTIVKPNFLDELIKTAEEWKKQGKLAFFGPRIYLQATSYKLQAQRIYSNGGIINWSQTKGTLKDYGKLASKHATKKPFKTNYISGTCILASKEVLEKVGLMREEYFLYYEDTDWAIRARKKGITRVIVPKSIIWHKASTTTKEGSSSYVYYHTRNGLHCGWENGNEAQRIAVICLSIWTFIKQPLKLFIPSKKRWVIPVARGVIDFWRGKMGKI